MCQQKQYYQSINQSSCFIATKQYNNAGECEVIKCIGDKGRPKRDGDPAKRVTQIAIYKQKIPSQPIKSKTEPGGDQKQQKLNCPETRNNMNLTINLTRSLNKRGHMHFQ